MMRSLLAATATALLLAGCATGDTGHLDPEIDPDLREYRSSPVAEPASGGDEDDEAVETPAPGASAAPGNDVEAAFSEAAGGETWFADVTAVDVDGDGVIVATRLQAGDEDAVAVCEAAFAAAQSTGVAVPTVDVRTVDGTTIAQRGAEDEGCAGEG